ncbi:MAG TPA: hypothetical protein VGO57_16850 [Verrucomicrobiae bacterium]|jgi:type I restriction enzyme M protein
MAAWSITSLRSVEDASRIDAEHYRPEYLKLNALLSWAQPLKAYTRAIIHPQEFPRRYSKSGWLVIRAQNVRPLRLEFESNEVFLDEDVGDKIYLNHLTAGDILVTRTGANFGQCSLYNGEMPKVIATSHTLIIRVNEEIDPAYLALFLNTKQGRLLLDQGMYGSSQPEIAPRFVYRIPVPRFDNKLEKALADNVRKAYSLDRQSVSDFAEAHKFLVSELGLDKLTFDWPVGYTAQFSEVEKSRRLDSEHFLPEFKSFVQKLPKKITLAPLTRHLTFCNRGKQPFYSDSGLPVVNSKHVQPNKVILDGNRQAMPGPLADLQIRYGDILMNGTGRGTLGRVAPYLANENALPDNHVTILRSSTLDPVYASFYLNSRAGQMQVEMHQRGSSGQIELYPFDIRKFQIWEAPDSVQKEIRKLYDRGAAAEAKSKQLLAEAKTRVEQLIEEAVAK